MRVTDTKLYPAFFELQQAWEAAARTALILHLARLRVPFERVHLHPPRWVEEGVLVYATIRIDPDPASTSLTLFYTAADLACVSDADIAEATLLFHAATEPPPPLNPWDEEPAYLRDVEESEP